VLLHNAFQQQDMKGNPVVDTLLEHRRLAKLAGLLKGYIETLASQRDAHAWRCTKGLTVSLELVIPLESLDWGHWSYKLNNTNIMNYDKEGIQLKIEEHKIHDKEGKQL
jgi:hypothetical protein